MILTLGVGLTVYGFIGGSTKTRLAGPILVAVSIVLIFFSCRRTFPLVRQDEVVIPPAATIHGQDNLGSELPPPYPSEPPSYSASTSGSSQQGRSM